VILAQPAAGATSARSGPEPFIYAEALVAPNAMIVIVLPLFEMSP
jgi:hypothetical protein